MTIRLTLELLPSVQERSKDVHQSGRLTIESQHWRTNEWGPASNWSKDHVDQILKLLQFGYPKDAPSTWADTRLLLLSEQGPGVWEFTIVHPTTD